MQADAAAQFTNYAKSQGADPDGPFRGESYDAAALILLAIQAAGSADRAAIQSQIINVANAPGEEIAAGQLAKGLQILANGNPVNYVGATNVEFNQVGEVYGAYQELEVINGQFKTIQTH